MLRSKLFVPGSRPELFAKALATAADALSFDLEDAVPAARKAEARAAVAEFLSDAALTASSRIIIVRTNAVDSAEFEADVASVVTRRLTLLNLPKIESAEAVRHAEELVRRAEARQGLAPEIGLLPNIETPRGLANAAAIAAAHPRVRGLQLGLGDLFEPQGIDRHDSANVHAAMFALRMAAAEAGVFALDGAYPELEDDEGYLREAAAARRLGFAGKTCVHPRQVALANRVFAASPAELEFARKVVQAATEHAVTRAGGVFRVDGRMIDAPAVKRAEDLLRLDAAAREPQH